MDKKKLLISSGIGITFCLCVIALAVFFFPAILNPFTPIYSYKMTHSTHTGYFRYTLTRGDATYESDYEEYALSSPGNDHQIGQTLSGMRLIEITGQTDYIVVYSFMEQVAVFRNSQAPPLDLRTARITDIKLAPQTHAPGLGPEKDSQDSQLIQEVIMVLMEGTPPTSPVSGSPDKYVLFLSGGDLTGMQYGVGVYVDASGQVYLAHDTLSKYWFQAGPLFTIWATTS